MSGAAAANQQWFRSSSGVSGSCKAAARRWPAAWQGRQGLTRCGDVAAMAVYMVRKRLGRACSASGQRGGALTLQACVAAVCVSFGRVHVLVTCAHIGSRRTTAGLALGMLTLHCSFVIPVSRGCVVFMCGRAESTVSTASASMHVRVLLLACICSLVRSLHATALLSTHGWQAACDYLFHCSCRAREQAARVGCPPHDASACARRLHGALCSQASAAGSSISFTPCAPAGRQQLCTVCTERLRPTPKHMHHARAAGMVPRCVVCATMAAVRAFHGLHLPRSCCFGIHSQRLFVLCARSVHALASGQQSAHSTHQCTHQCTQQQAAGV